VKNIIKLKFVIISISTIITICVYSLISANSSQLAPNVENLVPNFWIYMNSTVGTLLAPLARRWHVFIFPDNAFSRIEELIWRAIPRIALKRNPCPYLHNIGGF
jgi:hypothetical protein